MTLVVTPAWAYVDPNAGGIIFQIAMPVLAIGGAAIALLKKRVSSRTPSESRKQAPFGRSTKPCPG